MAPSTQPRILDTVLLLALPASGKSEVRKYLAQLDPAACARDFHMGPTVQLDDFPYVHLMRRIDEALVAMGQSRVFFQGPDRPFREPRDWGTLIELINEDHAALTAPPPPRPASAGALILDRIDHARGLVGAQRALAALPAEVRARVRDAIEPDARALTDEQAQHRPGTLEGKTLVIEFARGGAQGSSLPLAPPFGYQYTLSRLAPAILERATILYIWVTPEESRRKNQARANPDDPGSILHHGVPMAVMLGDYGCDDMAWLIEHAEAQNTVPVDAHGKRYHLPVARFDNRIDKTSFVRADAASWNPADVAQLHDGLEQALTTLAKAPRWNA